MCLDRVPCFCRAVFTVKYMVPASALAGQGKEHYGTPCRPKSGLAVGPKTQGLIPKIQDQRPLAGNQRQKWQAETVSSHKVDLCRLLSIVLRFLLSNLLKLFPSEL